jgi:hypothetical protein
VWEDDYLNDIWRHGSSDRDMRSTAYWVCENYERKKVSNPKFKVGDKVRLKKGHALMTIVKTQGHAVQADYVSRTNAGYRGNLKWRSEADFVLYKEPTKETLVETLKGNTEMKNKLYQTKEAAPRFGILLAVNSQGKLVLEMKGTNEVLAFDKDEVEVVTPFTFAVKFPSNNTEYHYLGKDGEVAVGDMLMLDSSPVGKFEIARVTAVNTRSEVANVHFKGVKLVTQRIGD